MTQYPTVPLLLWFAFNDMRPWWHFTPEGRHAGCWHPDQWLDAPVFTAQRFPG